MADHADEEEDDGDNVFVYTGGRAPQHVTHVRIDESVDVIEENAFRDCEHLVHVETHGGIRKVGMRAFYRCLSLRGINLKSVAEIDRAAFYCCRNLESVEFGDKLDTIGACAFQGCSSLQRLKLPSIITIGASAFLFCSALTDIELSERLETIGKGAFIGCDQLQRIAIPLKRNLFEYNDFERYDQFDYCGQLRTVDLIGGIHTTVSSLHMESWRTEMIARINRINQVLPDTGQREQSGVIKHWMDTFLDKMDHYKDEHRRYVKEAITLLELALWKAKLDEKEDTFAAGRTKKAKVDADSARKERRVTCGADIVIKNVLPFLQLE